MAVLGTRLTELSRLTILRVRDACASILDRLRPLQSPGVAREWLLKHTGYSYDP